MLLPGHLPPANERAATERRRTPPTSPPGRLPLAADRAATERRCGDAGPWPAASSEASGLGRNPRSCSASGQRLARRKLEGRTARSGCIPSSSSTPENGCSYKEAHIRGYCTKSGLDTYL